MGKMKCRVAKEVSLAHLIRLIGQHLPGDMTRAFIPTYRLVTKFHKFFLVMCLVVPHGHCIAEPQLPTDRAEESGSWRAKTFVPINSEYSHRLLARPGVEGVCQLEACFMGG